MLKSSTSRNLSGLIIWEGAALVTVFTYTNHTKMNVLELYFKYFLNMYFQQPSLWYPMLYSTLQLDEPVSHFS